MEYWQRLMSVVGGRRALFALGGVYVLFGLREATIGFSGEAPVSATLFLAFFMIVPGVVLLVGAYRLPETGIEERFYPTVTAWCFGAVLVLAGFLILYHVQPGEEIDNPVRAIVVITGFAVIPAYAGGVNNARAKTRAHELDRRNQELQRTQSTLEETVDRLEEANERLQLSNERLEQFAYAASHDLQEPLRMVSSYLRLIEDRADEELTDETREFLDFAVDGADRMRSMVDGLLVYSRVETAGEPLEPVDLNEVVADVRHDLDAPITESDAELSIEALPRVMGDESQLRQVFQNLLANAIQYSGEEPPQIHVSAERKGELWEISVRDEGVGIDPEDQDRIFEVFQRLNPRSEHPGSGIGLALCQRIVERHGGDIRVESTPGAGSEFLFTLPAVDGVDE